MSLRAVTPHDLLSEQLAKLLKACDDLDVPASFRDELATCAEQAAGLEPYLQENATPPSSVMHALAEATRRVDWDALFEGEETLGRLEPEMLCGPVEARFLSLLTRLTHATRVLEVGMFTGYSAIAIACALPKGGELVALEREPFLKEFSTPFFVEAGVDDVISVHVGDALESLERLRERGERFDLAFVDAYKPEYRQYCEVILNGLLNDGGAIAVDNTLMQGDPWRSGGPTTPNGEAVAAFNAWLSGLPGVERVTIPLRDGVTLLMRAKANE